MNMMIIFFIDQYHRHRSRPRYCHPKNPKLILEEQREVLTEIGKVILYCILKKNLAVTDFHYSSTLTHDLEIFHASNKSKLIHFRGEI